MGQSTSPDKGSFKTVKVGKKKAGFTKSGNFKPVKVTKTSRKVVVEKAIHSGEMEGVHVSEKGREDANEYVAGHIDSDQLVARARARYGLD
ncbi:hypothetical protein ACFUC1_01350 [Pedococcus sp. NPDC057267]|uniref:antitoxin VbhA family protein n=1 Tax=Pedococcus sp. NPDC057267 TaxID=3346077 RepID=UPI003626E1AE